MKKKIVHVTFDMHFGGAESVILNLVEGTDRSKYDVSIICLNQPIGPLGKRLQNEDYQVVSFNRKPGFDISLIKNIRQYIVNNGADILHCHQYTPYIYGLFSAMFKEIKVIFTEHGRFYPDKRKLKRFLLNPILNMITDHVTAISFATKDALVEFENFPGEKIMIIYNGIDDSKYMIPEDKNLRHSLGIRGNANVLGTVARFDPIKNLKMMIKGLKIIRQRYPDTFLIIIGDGPERNYLELFARQNDLASNVIFTGFREDTERYLKIMDIFLLTSFSEGTAMTLLEAMASSLPCVVTDVGGNPEIVHEGKTGFLIPSDDEYALADKVCILFGNGELMKTMGQAGRKRFKENFTVDRMVSAYEALYDSER